MKLLAQHLHRAELRLLRAELTGTSGSTFQMRTQSFASADAQGWTSLATPFSKHKNPLVLFSAPLKPKMQMEEEARSMWRTWPYSSPLLQRRGELLPAPTAREGCGLQAGWEGAEHFGKPCCHFLLSFQGQMLLVTASDTGKESILVASSQ